MVDYWGKWKGKRKVSDGNGPDCIKASCSVSHLSRLSWVFETSSSQVFVMLGNRDGEEHVREPALPS